MGELLKDLEVAENLKSQLLGMLNGGKIPNYLKLAKLNLMVKSGTTAAQLD